MHEVRRPEDLPGRDEKTMRQLLDGAEELVDDISRSAVSASSEANSEGERDEAIAAAIMTDQVRAVLAYLEQSRNRLKPR